MSNTKHTPGPWEIGEIKTFDLKSGGTNEVRRIDSFRVFHIAEVYGDDKESIANAKLIAAAPELLETLRELVALKILKDTNGKDDFYNQKQPLLWDKAKAAIKKATE